MINDTNILYLCATNIIDTVRDLQGNLSQHIQPKYLVIEDLVIGLMLKTKLQQKWALALA